MATLSLLKAGQLVAAPYDAQVSKWVVGTVLFDCPEGEEFVDVEWETGERVPVTRSLCVRVFETKYMGGER